jgi:hypothetical protein
LTKYKTVLKLTTTQLNNFNAMAKIQDIAQILIDESEGMFSQEILDAIPTDLRETNLSREALTATIKKREEEIQELGISLNLKPNSQDLLAIIYRKKLVTAEVQVASTRARFFSDLAEAIGSTLHRQMELAEDKKT